LPVRRAIVSRSISRVVECSSWLVLRRPRPRSRRHSSGVIPRRCSRARSIVAIHDSRGMQFEIAVADPQSAGEADLLAVYELEGVLHLEATPADPRPGAADFLAYQRADRGEHHRLLLLARGETRLAGAAWMFWSKG